MTTAPIPQGYPAAQPFTPASYPGLAGKVVLNTGAGSGIGRAMAHAFARHGAKLMLLDIDTAGLEQTRAQLREAFPGVEVHIVQASIADDVAVEQACAATEARFGRIDILLNNAGISMNKPSLELTPAEWRRAWGETAVQNTLDQFIAHSLLVPAAAPQATLEETATTLSAWLHITDRCNLRCDFCGKIVDLFLDAFANYKKGEAFHRGVRSFEHLLNCLFVVFHERLIK